MIIDGILHKNTTAAGLENGRIGLFIQSADKNYFLKQMEENPREKNDLYSLVGQKVVLVGQSYDRTFVVQSFQKVEEST